MARLMPDKYTWRAPASCCRMAGACGPRSQWRAAESLRQ
jgi:hypothetical protein